MTTEITVSPIYEKSMKVVLMSLYNLQSRSPTDPKSKRFFGLDFIKETIRKKNRTMGVRDYLFTAESRGYIERSLHQDGENSCTEAYRIKDDKIGEVEKILGLKK